MLKKLILKFSSLLYRIHLFINRNVKPGTLFKPYILKNSPSQSDITIVHVIANFIIGGSTQLVVDIIERTSDKFSHKIIVPEYDDPLLYQPVDIYSFSINEMAKLYNFLKQEKPALVHIHYYVRETTKYEGKAFWYYAVFKICEDLGIKVIQNVNVPTQPFENPSVVHNVFVSEYVRDNFNGNSPVSNSVIYPGSDFSHFTNETNNAVQTNSIGMVYRLDEDKLNPEAIEVFIQAVKNKPEIHCYIVGGGYYLKYYKERVAVEKMDRNFTFTGFISYELLPEYYKKFEIFIAPVQEESFGQVTPFAMSMGLAVAGYDIGALSEILGYKDTLVESGNIEKLAKIIIELISQPGKRKEWGTINQKKAQEKFSVEKMINEYISLYDSIIN